MICSVQLLTQINALRVNAPQGSIYLPFHGHVETQYFTGIRPKEGFQTSVSDLLKALRSAPAACKINAAARGPINNLYACILSAFQ